MECECCGLNKEDCQEHQVDENVSVYICDECFADVSESEECNYTAEEDGILTEQQLLEL